jgi:hypothetical protein
MLLSTFYLSTTIQRFIQNHKTKKTMKQITLLLALVLASFTGLRAQTISVDNSIGRGDIYIKAYAYVAGSCGSYLNFAQGMIPAGTAGTIDLTIAANWNLGGIPGVSYSINYVTVSRDPSCPGSMGWGSVAGPCSLGGVAQFDQLTLGVPACGYNAQGCLTITFTGSSFCSGFQVGDVEKIQFTPGGSSPSIDVVP